MNTGTLDRRTVVVLALGVAAVVMLRFVVFGDKPAAVVSASDSIPMAEKRLAKLRAAVATVPGKEKVARVVANDLAMREHAYKRGAAVYEAARTIDAGNAHGENPAGPPREVLGTTADASCKQAGDNFL